MEIIYLVLAIFAGLVLGVGLFFILNRNKGNSTQTDNESMVFLQNQMNELSRLLDDRMGGVRDELKESTRFMHESLHKQTSESSRLIKEITSELVKVGEGQKQVVGFADQLKELQDILKNPKQRGVLGEYYLETILKNVLSPGNFEMQYKLGKDDDGKDLIPDAVVFVKDKIVPIDSKFSLENYNRLVEEKDELEKARLEKAFVADLKLRIKETSKYIRPNEGTMEFAFMFVPHEAIYYDLLINRIGAIQEDTESLIQRAASKYHVIIVSPTSFLAYLQTVLQGLKALQIEESAKEIRKKVGDLGKHISAYDTFMQKMGNSLGTTVNHYNRSYKEFKKIDKDVMRISDVGGEIEPLKIDKPNEEDE